MPSTNPLIVLCGPVLLALTAGHSAEAQDARVFECGTVFTSDTTPASLAAVFGEANVVAADIHIGEGRFETGTVIFNGTENLIEVLWKTPRVQRSPSFVRIRGDDSSWVTPDGLKLGLDLRSIEAINGGPFRLRGFGADGSGMVRSWDNGRLRGSSNAPCKIEARLASGFSRDDSESHHRAISELVGEGTFSSGHPAMQLLNPTIYELLLLFR